MIPGIEPTRNYAPQGSVPAAAPGRVGDSTPNRIVPESCGCGDSRQSPYIDRSGPERHPPPPSTADREGIPAYSSSPPRKPRPVPDRWSLRQSHRSGTSLSYLSPWKGRNSPPPATPVFRTISLSGPEASACGTALPGKERQSPPRQAGPDRDCPHSLKAAEAKRQPETKQGKQDFS